MEIALYVVGGLIALVLALKLVRFLFVNYVTSRFLCIVACIWSLVIAFQLSPEVIAQDDSIVIVDLFVSTFAWMFYIGPIAFDVEWDGTFRIFETDDGYEIAPNTVGGFFANFICSSLLVAFLYVGLGEDFIPIFFIIPILILLLCIINIIKSVSDL